MSQPVQEGSGDAGQQSSGTSPKSATMRMGEGMGGQEALWLCLPTLPSPEERKILMIVVLSWRKLLVWRIMRRKRGRNNVNLFCPDSSSEGAGDHGPPRLSVPSQGGLI